MSAPLVKQVLIIPAGCDKTTNLAGTIFYCQSATLTVKVAFDNEPPCDFSAGWKRQTQFEKLTFTNPNATEVALVFYVGQEGLDYIGTDTQKDAPTFALGNKGTGSTFLSVPARVPNDISLPATNLADAVVVPGIYQGHLRKTLVVSTYYSGANSVEIYDSAGNFFAHVPISTIIAFDISDTLKFLGVLGVAQIGIGEIYYMN
jgi:hypothetical protein